MAISRYGGKLKAPDGLCNFKIDSLIYIKDIKCTFVPLKLLLKNMPNSRGGFFEKGTELVSLETTEGVFD